MSRWMDERIERAVVGNPNIFTAGMPTAFHTTDLALHTLREVNVQRCEAVFHPLDAWSHTDWATAVAGETGEYCNVIKKIRRLDGGDQAIDTPEHRRLLGVQAVLELADVVIYADLCAARLRKDLAAAIRWKFNAVSEERGTTLLLPLLG